MTKDEKVMFERMMEILERIEARLGEHEVSPAMAAALVAEPDQQVCIDAAPEEVEVVEVSQATAAAVVEEAESVESVAPVTQEELSQINAWLVQVAQYMGDRGAAIKGVLTSLGAKSITELADDRPKIEELKQRVQAAMMEKANA